MIGGLLFATCATLVFVPTLFSLVHARGPKTAAAPAGDPALQAGA